VGSIYKDLTEMFIQWIQVDILNRDLKITIAVIAAASGGFTDINPVGGFVASALKSLFFNKGFQQI
jgi:hypothetical protein